MAQLFAVGAPVWVRDSGTSDAGACYSPASVVAVETSGAGLETLLVVQLTGDDGAPRVSVKQADCFLRNVDQDGRQLVVEVRAARKPWGRLSSSPAPRADKVAWALTAELSRPGV